jgi:hypothetical protein
VTPRTTKILAVIGATIAVACVDMSAPNGPASISLLQLPSPSVVVGDSMRDSTGAPAALNVIAYDASGAPLSDFTPQFFITDTAAAAHIVSTTGILVGDKLGSVRIIGQIGALQTPVATVPVTVAPTLIERTTSSKDTLEAPLTADTSVARAGKLAAAVLVTGADKAGAQGFVVHFTLAYAPRSANNSPAAVFLADERGKPSTVDTTDASGRASRDVVVITPFLGDSAVLFGQVDSVVVVAETSYRRALVSGAPVRIVIPLKVAAKLP